MARTATVQFRLDGAGEEWSVTLPDDAPDKITAEWLNAHLSDVTFEVCTESWNSGMTAVEVEEDDD